MSYILQKRIIYLVVFLISVLLVANILLTYFNNKTIKENRNIQLEVEKVKTYYDQIGKSVIHSLDIGLRGYAIVKSEKFAAPLNNGLKWKDSIVNNVEVPLQKLNYNFQQFNIFKDSLNAYAKYCFSLKQLLRQGRQAEFEKIFSQDRGAHLWYMYIQSEADIAAFLNQIYKVARKNYDDALLRNQILQILLFLLCVPTLFYTAFFTIKNFKLSELLRSAEHDKNNILLEQNEMLERKVKVRTQEIILSNEEVSAQSEALSIQNKQLYEAQKMIEIQHKEIQSMNAQLKTEVDTRTRELREANKHLLEQNNQLEQFAFIAAHNLRAPLTRILGLANLIQISDIEEDRAYALVKLVSSTEDLDYVIRDLNTILNIRRQTSNMVEVNLENVLSRVQRTLEKEIESTDTVIKSNFNEAQIIYAVPPYVESILYNLISNAVKYRDPERTPLIVIGTAVIEDYICLTVADNGLGIDLVKHRQSVFNLYKRFHLHMEGRGLGLYLVRTQIEAMGGKIDLQSVPNEGSTFSIYFRRYLI